MKKKAARKAYAIKAVVSSSLAQQVRDRAQDIDTSIAEFVRDALAYYLLAFQEAEKGYSPAFINDEGKIVTRISDCGIEGTRQTSVQRGKHVKSDGIEEERRSDKDNEPGLVGAS